jgi:hypothetical protein
MLTGKQPDEYIGDVRTQAKKERCNVVVSSLYLGCVIMMAPQPLTPFFEKTELCTVNEQEKSTNTAGLL